MCACVYMCVCVCVCTSDEKRAERRYFSPKNAQIIHRYFLMFNYYLELWDHYTRA